MPTPPIPYTTVVSPGRTPPAFTAVPQPVGTPQPTSATVSSGRSSSILMQECSDTTERWENVPSRHIWPKSSPSAWNRNVPSGRQLSTNSAPRSHRLVMPWAQNRQCPQVGRNEQTTWSPGLSRLTPVPTSSTTPAPSCPPTIGYRTGMSPVRRWSSEWQRPAAANRIRTSPSLGGSRSISMTSQSLPMSLSTAALVFMRPPAGISRPHPPVPPACHCVQPQRVLPSSCSARTYRHWPARKPGGRKGAAPGSSAARRRVRGGAQLQLRAVVGGPVGQFGAVPGDDLPDPPRRQRAEQVVARDEQLPGRSPRPGRRQQLRGQVGIQAGERAPLVHHPGPGDERVGRRHPPGHRRVPQLAGEGDEALIPLAQPVQVPGPGRDLSVSRHRGRPERAAGGDVKVLQA